MANAILFIGWNRPYVGLDEKAFGFLTTEGLAYLKKQEGKYFERMGSAQIPDDATYHRTFGITPERLRKASPGAIVMHPGPMNRDVEIASAVADGPQSVIQRQVANGVAVRMAVLATIARNVQARRQFGSKN